MSPVDPYPIAVIQDRYTGVYAKGTWLAIANSDVESGLGMPRVAWCLAAGPHGEDVPAMQFWENQPHWIAAGSTPDKAVKQLLKRLKALANV